MTAGRATKRRRSANVLPRLLAVDVGHGNKDTLCLCLLLFLVALFSAIAEPLTATTLVAIVLRKAVPSRPAWSNHNETTQCFILRNC